VEVKVESSVRLVIPEGAGLCQDVVDQGFCWLSADPVADEHLANAETNLVNQLRDLGEEAIAGPLLFGRGRGSEQIPMLIDPAGRCRGPSDRVRATQVQRPDSIRS
jgi:hypothetical protein